MAAIDRVRKAVTGLWSQRRKRAPALIDGGSGTLCEMGSTLLLNFVVWKFGSEGRSVKSCVFELIEVDMLPICCYCHPMLYGGV